MEDGNVLFVILGTHYTGSWKDNLFHGHGKLAYPNQDVYEGFFDSGKAHGQGKFIHANGTTYVGGWVENKQHGLGKETYPGIH